MLSATLKRALFDSARPLRPTATAIMQTSSDPKDWHRTATNKADEMADRAKASGSWAAPAMLPFPELRASHREFAAYSDSCISRPWDCVLFERGQRRLWQ